MRCGDNGGDLDGVSPINGAECALDHCILTSGCVGMIISIEFIVSLPFCARNLARYSIGISDMQNMGNMEHTWVSCGVCYDTLVHELTRQTSARNINQVLARHSKVDSMRGGVMSYSNLRVRKCNKINTTMKWGKRQLVCSRIPVMNQ